MSQHKDLTGTDLHEPKGIATTTAGKGYFADGAGSGTWKKVTTTELDTTSVKNVNKTYFTGTLTLGASATTLIFPFTLNATVTKITAVLSGALTTATTTVTATRNGSATLGTMSCVVSGSAKGTIYTITPSTNNTFVDTDRLELNSAGGTGTAQTLTFLIEVSLT